MILKPKVTVYMATHNYGQYIEQAIDSIFAQTLTDWELIIINDGSTDNTSQILKKYQNNPKIRIMEQEKKGLPVSNNIALRLANGQYLIRLDADDYLDENALFVMSSLLDSKEDIGLVYPDYYTVDNDGEILELVRRKKVGSEVKLLDLPAHGACTMFRKECLLELGGYEEKITCQDGYDLWIRFLESFKPYNINIPLFYYRQHENSLTKDGHKILDTRASILRNFVDKKKQDRLPEVLAIIPTTSPTAGFPGSPFNQLDGQPLLWHTLNQASKSKRLGKIAVTSNNTQVLEFSHNFNPKIHTIKRPDLLATSDSRIIHTVKHTLKELKEKEGYQPEAVMLLHINVPLRRSMHIDKAIDTMIIFDIDSVVSVTEELSFCYHHGQNGLVPVQENRDLKLEKKGIYKENGAIFLCKVSAIHEKNFIGGKTGHIMMLAEESIRIKTPFDLWLAQKVYTEWRSQ